MKTRTRYRHKLTGQLVWFDTPNPQPGQRITVTKIRGFDIVRDVVWFHPAEYSSSDATDGCATEPPARPPSCPDLLDRLLAARGNAEALEAVADDAERHARELEAEAARIRVIKMHAEHAARGRRPD